MNLDHVYICRYRMKAKIKSSLLSLVVLGDLLGGDRHEASGRHTRSLSLRLNGCFVASCLAISLVRHGASTVRGPRPSSAWMCTSTV